MERFESKITVSNFKKITLENRFVSLIKVVCMLQQVIDVSKAKHIT